MILITERLTLSPLSHIDYDFFKIINQNESVREFLWDGVLMSEDALTEILERNEKHFKQDGFGLYKLTIVETGVEVGYVGLWPFFDEEQPQLLYAILPEHHGKGYATESAQTIIRQAFDDLGYSHLIASMDKPNTKSTAVCERLGFELVGERQVDQKSLVFYKLKNDSDIQPEQTI